MVEADGTTLPRLAEDQDHHKDPPHAAPKRPLGAAHNHSGAITKAARSLAVARLKPVGAIRAIEEPKRPKPHTR